MSIPDPVFRPAFNVTRASHVVHRVRDLAKSRAFYVDTLGFVVSDDDHDTLYLRGLEEGCHHSIVLKAGAEPACERVGLREFPHQRFADALDSGAVPGPHAAH